MRGGRRQGCGIIENENLQGTQTDLLTYVESEGCQDGRDGRERGVDEHAPLVLSIHIHDFYYVLVVEKMLSYSLSLGLSGCWRCPLAVRVPVWQETPRDKIPCWAGFSASWYRG